MRNRSSPAPWPTPWARGKAVISTPYWYAEDLLAEGRGVLTPFRNAEAMAEHVIDLLDNEPKRHAMRKKAYLYGRAMIWPHVAELYMDSFNRARAERRHFVPSGISTRALDKQLGELPPLRLDHLRQHDGHDRHAAARHFHRAQLP